MTRQIPRVVRNDWSSVAVPDLDGWRPSLSVSVVIPAFDCQPTLDLSLASLSRQTYPSDLLDVVVVDDGSDPPMRLPEVRPRHTTLIRSGSGDSGWGKSNAVNAGVAHSSGEIVHLLDADTVVNPEHVAALTRWQHAIPYAVTLGYRRFLDPAVHEPWPSPEQVLWAWDNGKAADLFGDTPGEQPEYQERYFAQTDQLRGADHLAFRVYVGATVAHRRELYDAAGGLEPEMRFGNDTEFGYRLAQAGAVFIPEPLARSWHLGSAHVMRAKDEVARYRRAHIADRVPFPRHWRRTGGTSWSVPLVEVVMAVADEPLELVRAAVDAVLRGNERDVRVNLVGPWDRLNPARVPALTDPQLDLRLIAATYRGEHRVRLVTKAPVSAFPSPYLLELPVRYGLAPDGIQRLIELADRHQAGVLRVSRPAGEDGPPVLLWRTSALHRARWVRAADEPLMDTVAAVHGRRDVLAEDVGLADLGQYTSDELAGGIPGRDAFGPARRRGRLVPSTVEVEGVRSLARAAVVVAWLGGRRMRSWLRGSFHSRGRSTQ